MTRRTDMNGDFHIYQPALSILFKYTVPVKCDVKTFDTDFGVGVLLAVRRRTFLLSAAHCLEHEPVLISDELTLPKDQSKFPIVKTIIHPEYGESFGQIRNDIGLLE